MSNKRSLVLKTFIILLVYLCVYFFPPHIQRISAQENYPHDSRPVYLSVSGDKTGSSFCRLKGIKSENNTCVAVMEESDSQPIGSLMRNQSNQTTIATPTTENGKQIKQKTPRPTPTPLLIPPPADPNTTNLMICFSLIMISVILFGLWINRRKLSQHQ